MLRFQAAGPRLCRAMATQAAGRERATTLTATKPESLLPALASKLAAWTAEQPPHILLFSLSKHLPRAVLSEAVDMLHHRDVRAHARVGFLSSSLPASVAYDDAAGMEHLHAISLASIPETRGVAFRSTIPGAARVSVGRWPNQKETWNKGTEMRSDRLDQSGGRDWRGLWGKENVDLRLPDQLNELEYVLKLIQSIQSHGLLEGLDAHFSQANLLGMSATLTPFETGREHTLFYDAPLHARTIHDSGAVGVALCGAASSSIERIFEQLQPIGPRLEVTGARGNIISTLDNYNAAQQFLRLILNKNPAPSDASTMEVTQVRELSSAVRKEDQFYVGLFEKNAEQADAIISGHPMRGTLSVATEAELGLPPDAPDSSKVQRWAQFYRPSPTPLRAITAPAGSVRYVFLATPNDSSIPVSLDPSAKVAVAHGQGALELPDVFLAASEHGWLARQGGGTTYACSAPYARASLCDV